jgi:hypothetical protein
MKTILKAKTTAASHLSEPDIEKQIRRGKAMQRELKNTREDLEDRRELGAAKKRNAGKPVTSLRDAARELGL